MDGNFAFGLRIRHASAAGSTLVRQPLLVRQRGTMLVRRFEIFLVRRALAAALFRTPGPPQNSILA
jgi:hypothetical protein